MLKYHRYIKLTGLLIIILSVQSCFGDEKIVNQINTVTQKSSVQVSETKIEIGQKITAHFINMDSIYVYSVTLNEKKVTFKQPNASMVTLIVPYTLVGNDIGNFVFYCRMNTQSYPDTVLISNQVNYKYENPPSDLYVKWNTNEKVTHYDSWKNDGLGQKEWKMQTNKDTIKFIRVYYCGDECGTTETLVFLNNGNNSLPNFLFALYDRVEWMASPIHIKINRMCKLMIDSWDSSSLYSGTFSSPDFSWVFWVKK